ncbi:MAG: response regulator transcription factor [Taibaiella sp.]|nr:response regulator transcription factor [Taibaiella sp.]
MKLNRLLLIVLLLFSWSLFGYTVTGSLGHMSACYHPRVYLEVIRDIEGFQDANAQNLIASADVSPDGTFTLRGDDLPAEKLFYRLYATRSAGIKTSIIGGANPNYILLALDNSTQETVTCDDFCSMSSSYHVTTTENNMLSQISRLRAQYLIAINGDIGESKKEFLEATFKKQMLDLSKSAQGISGFYTGYLAEATGDDLSDIAASAKARLPQSVYTRQLVKMAELDQLPSSADRGRQINILLFSLLLLSVFVNVYLLFGKRKVADTNMIMEQKAREMIETLSIKEREILKMVHEGLSNKEIANKHNIEVSTVKTHVSRIYQKTGIRNRKEVAAIARYA